MFSVTWSTARKMWNPCGMVNAYIPYHQHNKRNDQYTSRWEQYSIYRYRSRSRYSGIQKSFDTSLRQYQRPGHCKWPELLSVRSTSRNLLPITFCDQL
jgi:hypothetical protein